MAERRMLAKSILDSDAFSDMPIESQMLYVRLNMAADDDGFVSNPKRIMRAGGFTDDSMKILIAKKFVLSFEYGDTFVYLIKHWKIHNYIQRDRYKASTFKQLLREVYLDENKAYSFTPGPEKKPALQVDTECIHDVSRMDTQVRLGKDRIGKVRLGKDRIDTVDEAAKPEIDDPDRWGEFWEAYPRKSGGDIREACMEYMHVIGSGEDPETLISAAKALAERTDRETFRYLPSAEKWLRNKGWLEKVPQSDGDGTSNIFLRILEEGKLNEQN